MTYFASMRQRFATKTLPKKDRCLNRSCSYKIMATFSSGTSVRLVQDIQVPVCLQSISL